MGRWWRPVDTARLMALLVGPRNRPRRIAQGGAPPGAEHPMAHPLFVYGTLRDPDLLGGVLARPLVGEAMRPAAAPGFRAVHYPGRIYPALLRTPGASAPGLVLTDLTTFEHDLLDAFEGAEYRRELIPVMLDAELHEAFAYLPAIAIPADAQGWTLEAWQRNHKPRVLVSDQAGAADIRQRLIAVRPH